MVFKLNISDKGKAWRTQLEGEALVGKKLGEKVSGSEISVDLEGYELEITGAPDTSGFPYKKDLQGQELKRVMFTRGWGMRDKTKGLRLRKSVRGNQLSEKTALVNLKVLKHGKKHLSEIFADQNKPKEAAPNAATAPAQ